MNPLSIESFASATKPNEPGDGAGRTFFKVLLLVSSLLGGGLVAQPAGAALTFTTTGTITSGSETGGLFGLPVATTSLVGFSYTLVSHYDHLGPNYFTTGDGTFAVDSESSPGLPGFVTAIINGRALTTTVTNSLASLLVEDQFDLQSLNQGFNGPPTGAFVNVSQELSCFNLCVPYADLNAPVSYTLGPFDFGTDLYTFDGAGFPAAGTPTASFVGTEATLGVVPEPPSSVLLATALLGLGILTRRRYA